MNTVVKDGKYFSVKDVKQLEKDFLGDKVNTIFIAEGDAAAMEFISKNPGKTVLVPGQPLLGVDMTDAMLEAAGWNTKLKEAPPNEEVMIRNENGRDVYATFDPSWGRGRGAWFNRKNQVLTDVRAWRRDILTYIEARDKKLFNK